MQSPATAMRLGRACLCALALAAWSGAVVRGGFSFDDREAIAGNPVVEGALPWSAAFTGDYWDHVSPAGHYRPLATLSLRLDRLVWGTRAAGFHLTNVLLHVGCTALLALFLLRLAPRAWPWFGVAVFAVHPALADAVAWISGRSSMFVLAAGLLGALGVVAALERPRGLALAALCAALGVLFALLGKEDGLVFAPLYVALAAQCSRRPRRSALWVAGAALAGLAAYLALRAAALGSALPHAPHAPLAGEPLGVRLLVAGRAALEGLRIACVPLGYPPNYRAASELTPAGVSPWLGALGIACIVALLVAGASAAWRRRSLAGAGLVLGAVALLPLAQVVPAGEVFAPRFLYLPLACAAPLVHALLVAALPDRGRAAVAAAVLLLLSSAAWVRAGVYADRASYARAVLAHAPRDARSWNDLGLAHEEAGRGAQAREAWLTAARLDPRYARPWSNLGRLLAAEGELEPALAAFTRAAQLGPSNSIAQCNLGSTLLRLGRASAARAAYTRATELAPRMAVAWRGLGNAALADRDLSAARAALERAAELDPRDVATRELLTRLDARDGGR